MARNSDFFRAPGTGARCALKSRAVVQRACGTPARQFPRTANRECFSTRTAKHCASAEERSRNPRQVERSTRSATEPVMTTTQCNRTGACHAIMAILPSRSAKGPDREASP